MKWETVKPTSIRSYYGLVFSKAPYNSKSYFVKDVVQTIEDSMKVRIVGILNLTNSTKYYSEKDVPNHIQYRHIKVPGKTFATSQTLRKTNRFIHYTLKRAALPSGNRENVVLIHCTHGVNRSSHVGIQYVLRNYSVTFSQALEKFESARGEKVEWNI